MTFHDWSDAAKKLNFIDRHQVPFLTPHDWELFRDDPVRFMLRGRNADVAQRIWVVAQGPTP